MSKGSVSQKNAAMAKYLAENGVRRVSQQCVICNKQVSLKGYVAHIETHK